MKDDIMRSFEYALFDYNFDFTVHNGKYVCENTRKAYYIFLKGYRIGECNA